jgi:hypothetical protein
MASSLGLSRFSHNLNQFSIRDFAKYPHTPFLAALAIIIFIPIAIRDYLTFLSYGPGGLPYNVKGWLMTNLLRLLSREQLSTRPYNDENQYSREDAGFLKSNFPPRRQSSRPKVGPHPVPQRQLSQLPDAEMRQELLAQFDALGKLAHDQRLIEIKQSMYERHHQALFVAASRDWHPVAQQTRGEITHVHAGKDGSIHVVLHPKDCEKVIEKGWGQRHALSGVDFMKKIAGFALPLNYVLVYAPRDEKEIEVAMIIVRASIQFMTGAKEQLK